MYKMFYSFMKIVSFILCLVCLDDLSMLVRRGPFHYYELLGEFSRNISDSCPSVLLITVQIRQASTHMPQAESLLPQNIHKMTFNIEKERAQHSEPIYLNYFSSSGRGSQLPWVILVWKYLFCGKLLGILCPGFPMPRFLVCVLEKVKEPRIADFPSQNVNRWLTKKKWCYRPKRILSMYASPQLL